MIHRHHKVLQKIQTKRDAMRPVRSKSLTLVLTICTSLLAAGCPPLNNNNPSSSANRSSSTGTGLPSSDFTPPPTSTSGDIRLINAVFVAAGAGAAGGGNITLLADSSFNTGITINNVCDASGAGGGGGGGGAGGAGGGGGGGNAKPCACRFSWTEINPGTGVGTTRTVDSPVAQALPYAATCAVPAIWDTEIPDGTQLRLSLVPNTVGGNTISFRSNTLNYTKNASSTVADFRDAEGRAIKNIMHYVCHDQDNKELTIEHDEINGEQRPNGSSAPIPLVPIANGFRINNRAPSAQAYWYDFYVRSNEVGSINSTGNGFTCPRVRVAKRQSSTATPTYTPQYFPLDSTFALALNASQRYPVEVRANIRINVGGGAGSGAAEQGVLGYAALPAADGTCPAIADSSGLTRRTFRLRRYTVSYPLRFNADGTVRSQSQFLNTIYIMDRPVDRTGQDPLKPLTRLGPKPCPFSFQNSPTAALAGSSTTSTSHTCSVPSWKLPYDFQTPNVASGQLTGDEKIRPYLYGLPDGKKYGLVSDDAAVPTVLGNSRTYCLANGTDGAGNSGLALIDNTSATCTPATPAPSGVFSNDFVSPKNIDGTAILKSDCPIFPPPAANLTPQASLNIRPIKGFVPEFLEDTNFKACAFQPSNPIDPDIVAVFNSYNYPRAGDRTTDDPKRARAFYCARTYPDPDWIEPAGIGGGPTKRPGHCDSGRPKNMNSSVPSRYYIPKTDGTEGESGYINMAVATNRRSVQDAMITSYAIMNERTYACAFTYNPRLKKKFDPYAPLTDLTTPRSGCCQRGSGGGKTNGLSRGGINATAENRGIHSLVDPVGPWYNRYGKPAFTMQSVLLSAAPYQLVPNSGSHQQTSACYTAGATHALTNTCQQGQQGTSYDTTGGHAIVSGTWTNENTGTPLGCYDPSEDP